MDAAATNDEVDTLLELARVNDYEPGCKPNPEKAFQYYKHELWDFLEHHRFR